MLGRVKVFNSEKGWGFITSDDGEDVFVHQSNIEGEGFRYLLPGEPVEFDQQFDESKNRWYAQHVRPPVDRHQGVVKKFDHAKGWGFITPDDASADVFFHYSAILTPSKNQKATAEEGEVVWFDTETKDGKAIAVRVKRADSRPPLMRFADMGNEEQWLSRLAAKAEPESWQHSLEPSKYSDFPILKSYVQYTFNRLLQEDRESPGKKIALGREGNKPLAAFNTNAA